MLSALLARLRNFGDENAEEDQLQMLVPLMVSAFPDLRPWLVREALSSRDTRQRCSNYYKYLSLLLDVDEGIDSARFEEELVEVSYHTMINSSCNECMYCSHSVR